MVEMLPGFYSYMIINSVAFLELLTVIPHHPPGEPATPAGREHLNGLWKWKSLPHPTPALYCPISTLFSFKLLPGSSTKFHTRARATFYNFFVSSGSVLEWKHSGIKTKKKIPQGFSPLNTTMKTLWALSPCFRLIVSSDIGRNRGRIHHWALQGMVNLLETGSLCAETHKFNSATQNRRSRYVTNVNK